MGRRGGKKGAFWRIGGLPLVVSLLCATAGWLLHGLNGKPQPDCDMDMPCALAQVGWRDYLSFLLIFGGSVASFVFVLVCLVLMVIMAVDSLWNMRR
jgi:hypothetical protein